MRNHKTVLSSRNLVGTFALFVAGGCQALFGVDLPDPKPSGDEGVKGLGGIGGSGGIGTDDQEPAGKAGAGGETVNVGGAGFGGAGNAGNTGSTGGPSCTAPEVACGSSCVDVTSSLENCGACGYACGTGSACTQGACAPQTVVSNVVAPFAFVLDATSLYFGSALANDSNIVQPAVRSVAREGNRAVS